MQGYIHLPTIHSCLPRIYHGELLSKLFSHKRTSLWKGEVFQYLFIIFTNGKLRCGPISKYVNTFLYLQIHISVIGR